MHKPAMDGHCRCHRTYHHRGRSSDCKHRANQNHLAIPSWAIAFWHRLVVKKSVPERLRFNSPTRIIRFGLGILREETFVSSFGAKNGRQQHRRSSRRHAVPCNEQSNSQILRAWQQQATSNSIHGGRSCEQPNLSSWHIVVLVWIYS